MRGLEDIFLHSEDTVELGQTCLLRVSWFSGLDAILWSASSESQEDYTCFLPSEWHQTWALIQQWTAYWGSVFF